MKLEEIDTLAISHLHLDHVGGMKAQRAGTFRLSREKVELPDWKVYAPTDMKREGVEIVKVESATPLGGGITALPPLSRKLWMMGNVAEMSLAVSVRGFGLVVVLGCGHPGLERTLDLAEKEMDSAPAAIVGGLHFPVDGSRVSFLGIPVQKYLGIGPKPWPTLTPEDANRAARLCKDRGLRRMVASGHDTSDVGLEEFRAVFGDDFSVVRVGEPIRFGGGNPSE